MTFLKESSIDLHVYLSIYYRLGVAFFQWNFAITVQAVGELEW